MTTILIIMVVQTFGFMVLIGFLYFVMARNEAEVNDIFDTIRMVRKNDLDKQNLLYDMIKTDLRRHDLYLKRIKTKTKKS